MATADTIREGEREAEYERLEAKHGPRVAAEAPAKRRART
jgi:hypothetical protein